MNIQAAGSGLMRRKASGIKAGNVHTANAAGDVGNSRPGTSSWLVMPMRPMAVPTSSTASSVSSNSVRFDTTHVFRRPTAFISFKNNVRVREPTSLARLICAIQSGI